MYEKIKLWYQRRFGKIQSPYYARKEALERAWRARQEELGI